MRIVIATHNDKKAGEMMTILRRALPEIEFVTLASYPDAPEPDETDSTYLGNAAIKARSAAAFTGELSLADDAGLEVDALNGAPGVHSKRFGGEGTTFPEKMATILRLLADTPEERRGARFRCAVVLGWPDGRVEEFEATCEGRIAREPSGAGGFGYDPIFWLPERGCTMAELTADEKHQISHRGKVLAQVVERLREGH